jgi:flagellar biosynthesis protein
MTQIKPELRKAVALFYDGKGAPQITAKGVGEEAEQIMRLAQENEVPTCDNPALVEMLSQLELGQSIPETLYTALAHIIAFAYQIRAAHLNQTLTYPTNAELHKPKI